MYLKLVGIVVIAFLLGSCSSKQVADLIVHHGKVYTVDSAFSTAEAFAVKDGKIIAVDKNEAILSGYKADSMVDAHGKAVYPGFIDAHAHFVGYGRSLFEVNLYDCKTWDEVVDRVKAFAKEHPAEAWIRGRGWDQNKFPGHEYPDNVSISGLFPDKPVLLDRVDGHAAIANARALQMAGVVPGQKIEGGEIGTVKDKLSGLLIDNAVELVSNIIPKPAKADYEKWLVAAQANCFAQGLTTITDCGLMYYDVVMIDTLQRDGKLQMRLYVMLSDNTENFSRYLPRGPYKTDRLYVKGIKAYADGALGSRGACLLMPYNDKPGWQGFLLSKPGHYDSLAKMLVNTDFQLCTHAIGDSGNRMVLNVYNKYLQGKNDKRWRIEHAQVVNESDFELFGKTSVVPSVQPTHATSDMSLMLKPVYLNKGYEDTILSAYMNSSLTQEYYLKVSADTLNWAGDRIGVERLKGAYAYKRLLEQNGWLPLGTDFPVEDISPFKTIYSAVYRKDKYGCPPKGFQMENALTKEQAIRGITIWAAKADFLENEVGSIEVGKKADFVILDADIMKVDERQLLKTKVITTYVGGSKVY